MTDRVIHRLARPASQGRGGSPVDNPSPQGSTYPAQIPVQTTGATYVWMAFECDVCGADDSEPLTTIRSSRSPDYRGQVVLCRRCGFATIWPRPAPDDYAAINRQWFGETLSGEADAGGTPEQGLKKARRVWQHIEPYYPAPITGVLDVGAGNGWSLEFLKSKFPQLGTAVIDPVADIHRDLWARLGTEAISTGLDSDWPAAFRGRFDLVICRHTLEHLLQPLDVLRRIAACLAPGGYTYIAVPNALGVRHGSPVRTDFLRPVHLHYFNRYTLARMVQRAGLKPVALGEGGELWGLFTTAPSVQSEEVRNSYPEQKACLTERLRQGWWADRKAILRMSLRRWIPKVILSWRRRIAAQ